jgi:solute carrier family 40 (iron-regulated transporter), member 1
MVHTSAQDFLVYFRHRVFLPSFAGACLYLTVLSFAGQMVNYLLSAGYSSSNVGIARTFAVVFEILATWLAPWLMGWIGPVRAGAWLLSSQMVCLIGGITLFWLFEDHPIISASSLVGSTILSRLGLRGFDLCSQLIIQDVSALALRLRIPSPLTCLQLECRGRKSWHFQLRRSRVAERLRNTVFPLDDRLLASRPV